MQKAKTDQTDAQSDCSLCWAHIILLVLSCGGSNVNNSHDLSDISVEYLMSRCKVHSITKDLVVSEVELP